MGDRTARAHFLGIGGIGTSALAQWLRADGCLVTGVDRARSDITDALQQLGIAVEIGEGGAVPEGTTQLVYSDAVPVTHSLRVAARARGIPERSYAELLGELTAPFRTVAVAGSHGKSTTTALVGLLLEAAGKDPTVVIGTRVPQWMDAGVGNYRRGTSDIAVVEADEYRKHFLTLTPSVAVVTNVDHDHVDAFPTAGTYREAFAEFLGRVRAGGTVVLPAADPALEFLKASVPAGVAVSTFAVGDPDAAAVVVSPPVVGGGQQEFRFFMEGHAWGSAALRVPGRHVVANAAAALAAVRPFGVDAETVRRVLGDYRGVWRRFERVGEVNGALVFSDYAHHPTELRALFDAARQWYPGRRFLLAFQPHQHARARVFAREFLSALSLFDVVILAEVYGVAGREEGEPVTTRAWVLELQRAGRSAAYAPTLEEVEAAIREHARPDDIVLVVGAGDIDTVARRFARSSDARGV